MKIENGTIYNVGSKDYVYCKYKRIDKPNFTYDKNRYAYWQSEVNKYSCSLHAAITVVSNNHNYKFSVVERKDILKLAISRGFDINFGWYMNKAVECVVDYCNEYIGMNLIFIQVPNTQIEMLCDLGFGVVTGYHCKQGMAQDRVDGVLGDDIDTYGANKYGHLISLWSYKKRVAQKSDINKTKGHKAFGLVDNYYPKSSYNETFIKYYDKLVARNVFFPSGYIIVKKDQAKLKTIEGYKQKIRDFKKIIKS